MPRALDGDSVRARRVVDAKQRVSDTHQALSNDGVVLESASGKLNAKKFSMNTKTRRIVFETVDIAYVPRSKK